MRLVAQRGGAMAEAAAQVQTGMSAVTRRRRGRAARPLAELGLEPANYNGGGQIVVAGELPALAALQEEPPAVRASSRCRSPAPSTPGTWRPAVDILRAEAAALEPADPTLTIWTNQSRRRPSPTAASFLDLLVGQVASPVRWDLHGSRSPRPASPASSSSPPPAPSSVSPSAASKGVPTVAVKTPDDLAAAHALIDADGAAA